MGWNIRNVFTSQHSLCPLFLNTLTSSFSSSTRSKMVHIWTRPVPRTHVLNWYFHTSLELYLMEFVNVCSHSIVALRDRLLIVQGIMRLMSPTNQCFVWPLPITKAYLGRYWGGASATLLYQLFRGIPAPFMLGLSQGCRNRPVWSFRVFVYFLCCCESCIRSWVSHLYLKEQGTCSLPR